MRQFLKQQVVCPPKMRGDVFTTAAVDTIDHNRSSTPSCHRNCTAFAGQGVGRSVVIFGDVAGQQAVGHLPSYYADVPPVVSSSTKAPVPPSTVACPNREYPDKNIKTEYCWLESVRKTLAFASDDEENPVNQSVDNMPWAAYHARHQPAERKVICPSAVLPLFHESAHTTTMVKHSMDVKRKAVQHLNAAQTPVVTFDQPLYAIAKQIQGKWSEKTSSL